VAVIASCWVGEEYDNQVACVRGGGAEKARWLLLVFRVGCTFCYGRKKSPVSSSTVMHVAPLRYGKRVRCVSEVKWSEVA
jgi:hypothetical protein